MEHLGQQDGPAHPKPQTRLLWGRKLFGDLQQTSIGQWGRHPAKSADPVTHTQTSRFESADS
jgi:hypothetical protein